LNDPPNRAAQRNRIPGCRTSASDLDYAIRWRQQPIDEFQSRGLSRPTSSEQNQRFSFGNREADVPKQTLVSEAVANFAELNDGRGFGAHVRSTHSLEWYRTRTFHRTNLDHSVPRRVQASGFDYNTCSEIASLGFISNKPPRGEEQSEKTIDNGICAGADSFAELCSGQQFVRTERNKRKHCVFGTNNLR